MQYILKDQIINQQGSSQKTSFVNINTLLGPTFPPKIINNTVLLGYEGISFVFLYSDQK